MAADAMPPANTRAQDLAAFFYNRGNARSELGRAKDAILDGERALELSRGIFDIRELNRLRQFVGIQYWLAGNPKKALDVFSDILRASTSGRGQGILFFTYRIISQILVSTGDINTAEAYMRRNVALIRVARASPGWRETYAFWGPLWETEVEWNRGTVLEARGRYPEAEEAYRVAAQRRSAAVKSLAQTQKAVTEARLKNSVNELITLQARAKARMGRLVEAEADAREAVLSALNNQGKYNATTPIMINALANILSDQGRYAEAERLARVSLQIYSEIGAADDTLFRARTLSSVGALLLLQRKPKEAAAIFEQVDKAIANWEPRRRDTFEISGSRIDSLLASGQFEAGVVVAQALLKREISRVGEKHFDVAVVRGALATGYLQAGRIVDALREFRLAIPVLLSANARELADFDDSALVASRIMRLQEVAEAYISLWAKTQSASSGNAAAETFELADAVRSRSVQHALAASSSRAAAKNSELAELIRKEQDLTREISAQLDLLNRVLSLPSLEREQAGATAIGAAIELARIERGKIRNVIAQRFPKYANLIDPKPPTMEEVKETLRPGEVFLSFYFGRAHSFVWAVPKEGPSAFAQIAETSSEVESKVYKLREALDPPDSFSNRDIPNFDLGLAYDIYRLLLEPVEAVWKQANSVIFATNGALGMLPLSLLPTAESRLERKSVPFDEYRGVPWLARTHSVTMVPSAAALRTLRQLPAGADKRAPLIGFGDPYFNLEQAAAAVQDTSVQTTVENVRGVTFRRRAAPRTRQINSADLALLPRLPDTAEELRSIALSLNVSPSQALHLGKDANEFVVKNTDLSRFRVIAFATHGLMPGDLNGLFEPALALSAPDVAGVDGDGLLTMEEVLALKLDADWVVLSACNTGTGATAGAEALSGLGRAFFYAGTRTLLVTNWPVVSDAARELVADIFRRQAANPKLVRAEALREAMLGLMDGPGYTEEGKTLYSYAHPLFWAPYSIIGDGGAN
jgi:CHAT domain-containing protein